MQFCVNSFDGGLNLGFVLVNLSCLDVGFCGLKVVVKT